MAEELSVVGSKEERATFTDVSLHYAMAREDLDVRIPDFDKKDVLFRSHINENKWPYRAVIFDPRIFTTLYEKTARILANKPRGRMIPRESGDAIGAKINNELLSFQWDDNERADGESMLAKWALMDLNTRKYGASFGLVSWKYQKQVKKNGTGATSEVFFDGPNFKPWNNRDVLHNPSYSTIKNWIQLRDYVTLQDLQNINDTARSKPQYKNLDLLKGQLDKEAKTGGDSRSTNYVVKNLEIKGLRDFLGEDSTFRTIEIVTEYRPDRWITFAPKHGVIIRDIPNPYDHGQIPVVQLKYYPIDDDIYGLSEIEPVEKLQNAINALVSQYLDAINMSLYAPLKIKKGGGAVEMHTLEFGPGKKWLMNDPATDVISHQQNIAGTREFVSTYRFLVGALSEALGETSAISSNALPGAQDKTATEIKDTAFSRSARDNFNQMFLAEALKKQMMFWFKMNQQFMFSNPSQQQKVIRITGKDAIKFFQSAGLDGEGLTDEGIDMLSNPDFADIVTPQDISQPLFPVNTKEGTVTKLQMEAGQQMGKLIIEPEDLSGVYDYIPDIGSMNNTANENEIKAKTKFMEIIAGSPLSQMIQMEGKKINATDFVVDYAEDIGFKNADQYIENATPMGQEGGLNGIQIDPATGQPIQGGAVIPGAGQAGMVNGGAGGIQGGISSLPTSQAQPIVP